MLLRHCINSQKLKTNFFFAWVQSHFKVLNVMLRTFGAKTSNDKFMQEEKPKNWKNRFYINVSLTNIGKAEATSLKREQVAQSNCRIKSLSRH